MFKIADQVVQFIEKTIKTWRVELTAGEKKLEEVKIRRGIFQGDALSPLRYSYDATQSYAYEMQSRIKTQ